MVGQGGFPNYPDPDVQMWVRRAIIPWNNMTNKLIYNEILDLIYYEFCKVVSDGPGVYTVTTNLQTLMEDRLNNSSNEGITRAAWIDFIAVVCEEFLGIETNGFLYEPQTKLRQVLRQTMLYVPNLTHRIAIYNVIDIYVMVFYLFSLAEEPEY